MKPLYHIVRSIVLLKRIKYGSSFLLIQSLVFFSCGGSNPTSARATEETSLINRETLITPAVEARFSQLLTYQVDSLRFPRTVEEDGTVRGVPSRDWTSGFFPGNLLLIYQLTDQMAYLERAEEWLPYMEKEKLNGKTHDMGFKINCSFGRGLKIRDNQSYEQVMVESAQTLTTRFNPVVGCLKSWDFGKDRWDFPVIIDNMMNLELLFEATRLSGDSSFYKIAVSHAKKTSENHFRKDNSSFHVIDYDPETGKVQQQLTHQGYSAASSWARGQAWGLYGFTMVYRYTKNPEFLERAVSIADFILSHPKLPEDKVPYWDFDDPEIPEAPRDVSAASIIASAFIELSDHTKDGAYMDIAKEMIATISSENYVLPSTNSTPFILDHSTGNMPKSDEIDVPIVYGDYYFLEALHRLNQVQLKTQ